MGQSDSKERGFKEDFRSKVLKRCKEVRTLKKDREKKQGKIKKIIEIRSSKYCVSSLECPTYLIPLSVCLSILCLFCISSHPQLSPS
jgi:hypothetical protein